jgi:apolipoprotein N-acyltransferase
VLLGLSQPLVIEALGDEPLDPTGLTGALALVGFVPLLLAMRGAGPRRAYWLGFLASFIQFTMNVQWLVVAMVVFGRIPLPASWLILSLLTSAMAAYVAAAYAITRVVAGRFGWPAWLVFPAALCATELFRNFGPLGGFPWGNVGTSFATVPLLLQPASLIGVHGLIFCAALVSACLAEVLAWGLGRRRARALSAGAPSPASAPFPRRAALVGAILVVGWVGFGAARLLTEPTGAPTVKVGLLQGNIEQGIRNHDGWTGRRILERYHELQDEALARGAQIVVWPEAAFPVRLRRDVRSLGAAQLVREGGSVPPAAVVGAVGVEPKIEEGKRREVRSNSAFIVGGDQQIVGRVDKTHLVPFGEYVPWPLGAIVRQIVPIGGTLPGSGYEGIPVEVTLGDGQRRSVKLGTTICYEGIFPEISRKLRQAGAELHVNVTNDGWYGISAAATQHLAFYAIRAVESGMPVVRAANTGKSGWADTRGRLHDVTPIYVHRAVVAEVPLVVERTLFTLLGEWVAVPCAVLILGAWIFAMIGRDVARRRRALLDNALGAAGLLAALLGAATYFLSEGLRADEANATRFLLLVLAGLLVGVGALSGRPWGRKAQLVVGALSLVVGAGAAALGAGAFAVLAVGGVGLFIVQLRRKAAYQRPADPLLFADDVGGAAPETAPARKDRSEP